MSRFIEIRRAIEKPGFGSWTVSVEDNKLTITGGTYTDAFIPVETMTGFADQLISDIQAAVRMSQDIEPSE